MGVDFAARQPGADEPREVVRDERSAPPQLAGQLPSGPTRRTGCRQRQEDLAPQGIGEDAETVHGH